MHIQLSGIDYTILLVYFSFVIGIGWVLKRYMKGSSDFFLSGRSIPAWVTGLAFLSANLGAQEVIGMGASGAKYGIMTSHFYWVGAIPAMVFLAIFMMPFYYGSKARSVPEYLKMRFDEKTRGLNAISFAVMTVFSSGISMHALAKLLELLMGWDYNMCILLSAFIVLVYIFLGGLTSAIYNEVLQFFMIVLGFSPLVILALKNAGGWTALKAKLIPVATAQVIPGTVDSHYAAGTWTQSWAHMGSYNANPMGADWMTMVFGLGFVLSFGYWCTDFLVVQRAMAANSMSAARRTPLIAAVPKMLFPALVILPGMIAIALHFSQPEAGYFIPVDRDVIVKSIAAKQLAFTDTEHLTPDQTTALNNAKQDVSKLLKDPKAHPEIAAQAAQLEVDLRGDRKNLDYNLVIPSLLGHFLPVGLLGIGFTALMASFMSGMAGNVTAFNTVWTYDIYQSYLAPKKSDNHYLWMGRMATICGIVISIGCAYLASRFNNIMDMLQLVFGFVNAPLFATFLLGMFWRRTTGHGAFIGLLSGTLGAAIFHGLAYTNGAEVGIKGAWIAKQFLFNSEMGQNFTMAIVAWVSCFAVTIIVSLATTRTKTDKELTGLVYSLTPKPKKENEPWYQQPVTLGVIILAITLVLNIIFW
ncbi:MAG: sodium solute transporter superfamily [Pedosphaera sp.]|nr:sodium solute transporter superfamily [Pedosphaera sp.]